MREQAGTMAVTGHRPWPPPDRPWVMAQSWHDLLFAHWRVPPEALRPVVHPAVPIDEFDGSAWIGVTPFKVEAHRPRLGPPPPVISSFLECNVRTYATVGGKPGIWFFSLDAESRIAVRGARRFWRLPYFLARMDAERRGRAISYRTQRVSPDGPPAELDITYAPVGPVAEPEPGSLEWFLTERYCLYTVDERGVVHRGDIHHPPWPLQPAEAELRRNTMAEGLGLRLEGEPLLHFAARQDVPMWRIRPIG
ncbi:MAG: DUF2071 domain-containing protein [Actinomycetota bacterium]|nr:DUF2071 domain-containing protein [Actinomycetota bacterium]